MIEIAQAATRDTTGDGQIDQWGFINFAGMNAHHVILTSFSNGARMFRDVDGRVEFAFDEQNAIETIQLWHDLINVYNVGPGLSEWNVNLFLGGNVAMIHGGHNILRRAQQEMEGDYGWVVFPRGPSADRYVTPVRPIHMWALPITADNPHELVAVTNALFELTDEWRDMADWEARTLDFYAHLVRDQESLETWALILESWQPQKFVLPAPDLGATGFYAAIEAAVRGEKSAAAAMAEVASAVQAMLDDLVNQ